MSEYPKVEYSESANAAYIYLREIERAGVADSLPLGRAGIILDFDRDKRLVGIEILDARTTLPTELL